MYTLFARYFCTVQRALFYTWTSIKLCCLKVNFNKAAILVFFLMATQEHHIKLLTLSDLTKT